jgi:hypothetical protein
MSHDEGTPRERKQASKALIGTAVYYAKDIIDMRETATGIRSATAPDDRRGKLRPRLTGGGLYANHVDLR